MGYPQSSVSNHLHTFSYILGLGDNTGNAWKYISKYSDDPLIAITKAMGTVEKVLAVLLG